MLKKAEKCKVTNLLLKILMIRCREAGETGLLDLTQSNIDAIAMKGERYEKEVKYAVC